MKKSRLIAVVLGALVTAMPSIGFSQPLTIVVPYAAGGSVDRIARVIADGLSGHNARAVVENRGGAGGTLGSGAVARAGADQNVVLIGQIGSQVLSPLAKPALNYSAQMDLKPIVKLGFVPVLFAVRPGLGVEDLKSLVELAKRSNPPLTYGSSGVGTSGHVAVEILKAQAGVEMTHVPFQGIAPIFSEMLGGRIDCVVTEAPGLLGQAGNGIKPLTVIGTERSNLFPDIRTTSEDGLPQWSMQNWYGVFASSNMPEEKRRALEAAFLQVLADPIVAKKLADAGLVGAGPASEMQTLLDSEFARWPVIFKELKIVQ